MSNIENAQDALEEQEAIFTTYYYTGNVIGGQSAEQMITWIYENAEQVGALIADKKYLEALIEAEENDPPLGVDPSSRLAIDILTFRGGRS